MVGRYLDFNVLDTKDSWDAATTKVVLARLDPPGPLQFFTAAEAPTLRAFCDLVLAQDNEPRIPVAEFIDAKLAAGELDGYQYADMPDDRETWRLVLRGLDEVAQSHCGVASFAEADIAGQLEILGNSPAVNSTTPHGRNSTPRGPGRCACGWPYRRSTPIPGRETRSGSVGRPTRAASCGWADRAGRVRCESRSKPRGATDEDPVHVVQEDEL